MTLTISPAKFRFEGTAARAMKGRRVLISGSGKDGGIGQSLAFAAALNGAAAVGVHFNRSYADGLATVAAINDAGGNAFPVQADVTNTSDMWASRGRVIDKMGGKPPDLVICNSGLSESGYLLGKAPRVRDGESSAMRRARARMDFVENLADSTRVVNTKIDGFLAMTHLWAGEAIHAGTQLTIVYVSSRQAIDPGPGVPGYVLANYAVLSLPSILSANLGRDSDKVTAFSLALPFVRTSMTDALVDNKRVFGRWQPRMIETHELAESVLQVLERPARELDDRILQLNATTQRDDLKLTWSAVDLIPRVQALSWSEGRPLTFPM